MNKLVFIFCLILLTAVKLKAQQQNDIPANANTIVIKGVTFEQVLSSLLDSGYAIEKKDNDIKTIRTEPKVYPKMYNAAYVINVRLKDTVAYFTGTYTAPWDDPFTRNANKRDPLFKDEPILNHCNKKGKPYPKSLARYPFMLMNSFVNCFSKPIEYTKL